VVKSPKGADRFLPAEHKIRVWRSLGGDQKFHSQRDALVQALPGILDPDLLRAGN